MVFDSNTASDISGFSKILKYYKTALLPNTTYRLCYYLFTIEAEKFSVTHKISLFRYGTKNKRRRLHSKQSFHVQTFRHVLVVLTFSSFVLLFTALTANFCISSPDISGNLGAMFLKVKT